MNAPESNTTDKKRSHATAAPGAPAAPSAPDASRVSAARRVQDGAPSQHDAPHTQGATAALHDAHCHLSFAPRGEDTAQQALEAGSLLFSVTVTPEEHACAHERFAAFPNVCTGLGLHPWWIGSDADGAAPSTGLSLGLFLGALEHERFIGEVGLDFASAHEKTRDDQVETFQTICDHASELGGRVLSIHAVRSAGTALDILESSGALDTCTCIFHWFSGTSDELARAVKHGCLFSVGPRMTVAKRGRAYLRAVPLDRLLLETDLPAHKGEPLSYSQMKDALSTALGSIVAEKGEGAAETLDTTMRRVFDLARSRAVCSTALRGI